MFYADLAVIPTPVACIVDTAPPTFAGISGLVANVDGSLTASWAAGSDLSSPVEYDVFIQADTATGLFTAANIQQAKFGTSARIYTLANESPLAATVVYFVGVRARDRLGNTETNTVSLSAMSNGVNLGSVSPEDLLTIVQNLTTSGQEIIATVDDDADLLGAVDGDDDLIGTVEDC